MFDALVPDPGVAPVSSPTFALFTSPGSKSISAFVEGTSLTKKG